jgi:thiamine biosynthesis lipoprotein
MFAVAFDAMGCQMQALAQPVDTTHIQSVPQALAALPNDWQQAEQMFSRFLPTSELMQLNTARSMPVSKAFWQMLSHSLASAKLTDGLITPTVYQALVERGYDQSYEHSFEQGQSTAASTTLTGESVIGTDAIDDWQKIGLDPTTRQVSLPDSVKLDFGGFAKGLTADIVADRLSEMGANVLIDAGGDIVIRSYQGEISKLDDATQWQVALPAVTDIGLPLPNLAAFSESIALPDWQCATAGVTLSVPVTDMTLATSGIDYRYWYQGDTLQHHLVNLLKNSLSNIICTSVLINPKMLKNALQNKSSSGLKQFLQVSNTTNLAQTLSKLCCLLGIKESLAWLKQHGLTQIGLSFIVAMPTGYQQWLNPTIQQFIDTNPH